MKTLFAVLLFAFTFSVFVPMAEAAPVKHHKRHNHRHHHHHHHAHKLILR